jgi:hypothetical protein
MKITPGYLEQNRALHALGSYGLSGQRWAPTVLNVCKVAGSRDILDDGCGQRTLEKTLGFLQDMAGEFGVVVRPLAAG